MIRLMFLLSILTLVVTGIFFGAMAEYGVGKAADPYWGTKPFQESTWFYLGIAMYLLIAILSTLLFFKAHRRDFANTKLGKVIVYGLLFLNIFGLNLFLLIIHQIKESRRNYKSQYAKAQLEYQYDFRTKEQLQAELDMLNKQIENAKNKVE